MAITFEINGIFRTIEHGSLNIDWRLNGRGVASFVSDSVVPSVGQTFIVKDGGTRIWGGTLDDVNPRRFSPLTATLRADCAAVTFDQRVSKRIIPAQVYGGYFDATIATSTINARSHSLANGNAIEVKTSGTLPAGLAAATKYYIINSTAHAFQLSLTGGGAAVAITTVGTGYHRFCWYAGTIVQHVVNNYINGELSGTPVIADGVAIEPLVCDYRNVGELFDMLATSSAYIWYVSPDEELMFFSRTTYTAPISIGDAGTTFIDLQLMRSRADFRDVQYVRGRQEIFTPEYASFLGDGTSKQFGLNYHAAAVTSVFVDSVAVDFGVWGVDTGKKFYWSFGAATVWQDPVETVLTSSNTLEVNFNKVGGNVSSASNSGVIAARAAIEGGTGITERIDDDSVSSTVEGVTANAAALLSVGSVIPDKLSIVTDSAGLEPGQQISVVLTLFGLSATFLIQNVAAHDNGGYLRYTITATSDTVFRDYVDFFKGLGSSSGGLGSSGGLASSTSINPVDLVINVAGFDFLVSGAMALTVGANTFTCAVPSGITSNSPGRHYVRIVDAVAGNEVVLISARTATSITFSAALAHAAGNWTLQSATAGIQEAFFGTYGNCNLIFSGDKTIYAKIILWGLGGRTCRLTGTGQITSRLLRSSTYPSGHLLSYDASISSGGCELSDFSVVNAAGFDNPSGAGIYLNLGQPREALLTDVVIINGVNPLVIDAAGAAISYASGIFVRVYVSIQAGYSSLYTTGDGITNNTLGGTFAQCQSTRDIPTATGGSGMKIIGADGMVIDGGAYNGTHGIKIQNNPALIMNFIYIQNGVVFDTCYSHGIYVVPGAHNAVFTQFRIADCHFATQGGDTGAVAIYIGNDVQCLIIANNNITGWSGAGVQLGVTDSVPRGVSVTGNQINNNGSGSGIGVVVASTTSGTYNCGGVISGNTIGNNISPILSATAQSVGVYFAGAAGKYFVGWNVSANNLSGNTSQAIFHDTGTLFGDFVIGDQNGVARAVTVGGAASVTLDMFTANNVTVPLDRATTTIVAPAGLSVGAKYKVKVVNDATAGRAIVWTGFMATWPPPAHNQAANGETIIDFVVNSTGGHEAHSWNLSQ